MPRLYSAAVLLFAWSTPAHAAVFAQADAGVPYVAYGAGLAATALVMLAVCWPARRN